jgi:hypothetical protein
MTKAHCGWWNPSGPIVNGQVDQSYNRIAVITADHRGSADDGMIISGFTARSYVCRCQASSDNAQRTDLSRARKTPPRPPAPSRIPNRAPPQIEAPHGIKITTVPMLNRADGLAGVLVHTYGTVQPWQIPSSWKYGTRKYSQGPRTRRRRDGPPVAEFHKYPERSRYVSPH